MRRSSTVMAVAATAAVVTLTAMPAHAVGTSYVALGDSYSAGVGTRAKVNDCYQSRYGYAPLIAAARSLTLNYQACSGATTSDVVSKQLSALNASTAYVSMTIGGNDLGFAPTLTECALPSWMSNCTAKINAARAVLATQLPGRLDSLYSSISTRSPAARVVIAGYPHIFQGEDCNLLTFFSPSEEAAINAATDDLDTLVRAKSAAHGFRFVDVRGPFTGHAVCDSTEWINGLSLPIDESYHPNRAGNVAYATAVAPALTGVRLPAVAASQQAPAAGARVGGDQSTAGVPGARTLRVGVSPLDVDLASPQSLAGATAAGIDPSVLIALQRDLESGDANRVRAAVSAAQALDIKAQSHART